MKEDTHFKELGRFLRSKRESMQPSGGGLLATNRRRTKGLRREEVASLSGISTTWYTWLEQGRSIQVSEHVMLNIAKALQMDRAETEYIFTLAQIKHRFNDITDNIEVKPYLQAVLDNFVAPAYIMDYRWNILAWNEHVSRAFIDLNKISPDERNLVRMMFCNDEIKRIFIDWDYHAKGIVKRLRATYANNIHDKWLKNLIGELCLACDKFLVWWNSNSVDNMTYVVKEFAYTNQEKRTYEFSAFDVADDPRLKLILHTLVMKVTT